MVLLKIRAVLRGVGIIFTQQILFDFNQTLVILVIIVVMRMSMTIMVKFEKRLILPQ
ncbi:MAG: hypothetical protein ABL913_07690 [Methyloglobulus sp.]